MALKSIYSQAFNGSYFGVQKWVRYSVFLLMICNLFLISPKALNAQQMGVAAVVNENIITDMELDQRIRLAAVGGGAQINMETVQKLAPQVLRGLIEETLRNQESKRNGICISTQIIDDAYANIAKDNNLPLEGLDQLLTSNGILISTLKKQLESQIAWQNYMQSKIGREIKVSDDEVDEVYHQEQALLNKPKYTIQELFIINESASSLDTINRIRQEIAGGGDFSALAKAFSQANSAKNGGQVGKVILEKLDGDIANVIGKLKIGELSKVVTTSAGYYIFKLLAIETPPSVIAIAKPKEMPNHVEILQLSMKGDNGDNIPQLLKDLYNNYKSQPPKQACQMLKGFNEEKKGQLPKITLSQIPDIVENDLREPIQSMVASLKVQEMSIATKRGEDWVVIALCNRWQEKPKDNQEEIDMEAKKEEIRNQIGSSKLMVLERRILRDLKRTAFIDVRM